ncbi:hypothetical protein NMY22_g11057 [Coprinellus aureogranulatus]|nr:hypothetical protein NMY22_g11057 [Coprinellus aureogranulatus]
MAAEALHTWTSGTGYDLSKLTGTPQRADTGRVGCMHIWTGQIFREKSQESAERLGWTGEDVEGTSDVGRGIQRLGWMHAHLDRPDLPREIAGIRRALRPDG